ncbi:MAG: acetyl-CoA decarbonylase/synthase complex subunit gamma [Armatimonadetes bacterium]|nr:acetyl-CoA decarbonylase/synthase complex subunit gamma [Armatimonadota bacterium]
MALTGLEIYKKLPKTNCGECGSPTCLAFAMKLAGKKAALDECPHVSPEAKAALGEASEPPVRLVTIGTGENKIELGNETVLFRHEQTFFHQTGIAIEISSNLPLEEIKEKIKKINNFKFERVGQILKVDLIAFKDSGGDYFKIFQEIHSLTDLPFILITENLSALEECLKIIASKRPLIYGAKAENFEKIGMLAKQYNLPLAIRGNSLDDLADLTGKIKALGINDLILDTPARDHLKTLIDLTNIRRLALKKTFRSLGYPIMTIIEADDPYQEIMQACTFMAKYAGIIVIKTLEAWGILTLLTWRQNIYTDPQKPIQVEAKIYPIGTPNENSPVLVTTNFSLTYFTVAGEIEASKIPAHLLIVDTDGTSVLTAWAADKFNPAKIAQAIKNSGLENIVKHRNIIIPGYVSILSGALKDESSWNVVVGPKEASGISAFLKVKGANWAETAAV